ncbi:fucose isomerase [Naasia lichenicola]|uniref:Fucose isomerase n=1 Tax=Naasia lichenicola TaxID=2565933 RepID=A0A4S4FGS8_9MICO|nr:fucose isomerase [Naasia lichenicola]THG29321.1 fucose isomerase [Naasia lichenicola]
MTTSYLFPDTISHPEAAPKTVYLVASGDLRVSANRAGWSTQALLEQSITAAVERHGWKVVRAHEYDPAAGHGFISSQAMGIRVFRNVPLNAPLIVAESIWQYSHHVLPGLRSHLGPILTAANFAGDFPGLVGLLNLNAGLTKMGRPYSTVWSVDFTDGWARDRIDEWLLTGQIHHDNSHVSDLPALSTLGGDEVALGSALAAQLQTEKAIIGIFDEGCMGMYNAIIDDEYLNPLGIYKERLSQSALYAEMLTVPDDEALAIRTWVEQAGLIFRTGPDDAVDLTDAQILEQCRMYIAALRIADDFSADAIGIQYQQGLKDLVPASDLVEGLLNNVERPPVTSRDGLRVLYEGAPLPHFNEVDEGVAVDALLTNRVWTAMGLDPATTLHDVRWGEDYDGRFVWVLEISGAVPPSHLTGGYAGSESWRQSPNYFPAGGGTIRGLSKPGEVVWSRIYLEGGELHFDIGRATAIELPAEESERRWAATNPEWPMMHAVLHGITRDQFMARHKANHLQVAYAPTADQADRALLAKAALVSQLGIAVHLCGDVDLSAGVPAAQT